MKSILTQTKEEIREKGYDIFTTHEKIEDGSMAHIVEAGKVNELCEFIDKSLDTLTERYVEAINKEMRADPKPIYEEIEMYVNELKGKLTEEKEE